MIKEFFYVCLWSFLALSAGNSVDFYVSPDGNDYHPGTQDAPYATLQKAQDAVRAAKRSNQESLTVYLRGGKYCLKEPLVFTAEDSGWEMLPVEFTAYTGEIPIISGGTTLNLHWEIHRDGIMKAAVDYDLEIDQLFVNANCYRMARFPNFDPVAKFFGGTSGDAIAPERVQRWSDPIGGYLHALHEAMWGSKHYRIVGVEATGAFTLQGGWQENRGGDFDPFFRGGFHKDYLFVENIFEELDAPGEWFYDQKKKVLYANPLPDDDLNHAAIIAAGLKELVIFTGSQKEPVKHIQIKGLHFQHTKRVFMEPYERLLRGDWSIARLGAVRLENAEDCKIADCVFADLGGNGVFISRYNRRISVEGNRFTRLGESAVCLVGDSNAVRSPAVEYSHTLPQDEIDLLPGPRSREYPAFCMVHNNLMHQLGRVGKQTAGVFISMAEEITVSHNTIYDVPRAAICINDGCWGGHVIEYNDAFDTVRESGDHGPFNSWGRDRYWKTSYNGGRDIEPFAKERCLLDNYKTTHIRNNRFAHAGGHSWGIDLDDGSSNYRVYDNLCLGMGVKLREGFFRRVENNIIIDGFGGFHIWFPDCDDVISHNIFVSEKPYQFIRANPHCAKEFDFNLFYNDHGDITITGVDSDMNFEQWQAKGLDRHSLFADPMFVDAENGDYRVSPDSPALKLGFKNFAMNQFGVMKPAFSEELNHKPRSYKSVKTEPAIHSSRDSTPMQWLGATVKNLIGESEKSAAGIGREIGVLVMNVPSGSKAAEAGFQAGDVILRMGEERVDSIADLARLSQNRRGKSDAILVFNAVERIRMLQWDD